MALGIQQVFDLSYPNHALDDVLRVELRARLIFLIRPLKIDTIVSYDPWGHYEENPDHYVTAQCVEAACWMAGGHLDFPEHFAGGLKPHRVREKYYYGGSAACEPGRRHFEHHRPEVEGDLCQSHDGGEHGPRVEKRVGPAEGQASLPRRFHDRRDYGLCRHAIPRRSCSRGREYGLAYAEKFHYIGPDTTLDNYLRKHTVPI